MGWLPLHLFCLLLPDPLLRWRRGHVLLPASSASSICGSLLPATLTQCRIYLPARASMTLFHLPAIKSLFLDSVMHPIIRLFPDPVTLACRRSLGCLWLHLLCLLLPGPLGQWRRGLALLPASSASSSTTSAT